MKIKLVAILGTILSFATIFILASRIENGDMNAVSMYLVVFLIPAIILALLNAVYIPFIDKLVKGILKCFVCFIPIAVLTFLSFSKNLTIHIIDCNLTFVASISAIALGITNLVWVMSILLEKSLLDK
jgi:hypothetical protein